LAHLTYSSPAWVWYSPSRRRCTSPASSSIKRERERVHPIIKIRLHRHGPKLTPKHSCYSVAQVGFEENGLTLYGPTVHNIHIL
jgi:hypothetical protein